MTSTAQMLLDADKLRARSQQREPGISELGSCRRKVGYKLAGFEPVNSSGTVQAVIGSAVHDRVAEILRKETPPGWLVEHKVELAGIPGTLDRYEADKFLVVDLKTISQRWLEHVKLHGPEHNHLWQVSGYGAALAMKGHRVERIRIDYLCRDTGEEYQWPNEDGQRFDIRHVRDAIEWLTQVRDTPVDMLPRDYEPDSVFCQGCPFGGPDGGICWESAMPGRDKRTAFYVEDPDAEKWMAQLWEARQGKKPLAGLEAQARGALDALKPEVPNQRIRAGDWVIAWDVTGKLLFKQTPADVQRGAAA